MSEWISITDKLPEVGVPVLIAVHLRNGRYILETDYLRDNKEWRFPLVCDAAITHWQPLPEPPRKVR